MDIFQVNYKLHVHSKQNKINKQTQSQFIYSICIYFWECKPLGGSRRRWLFVDLFKEELLKLILEINYCIKELEKKDSDWMKIAPLERHI